MHGYLVKERGIALAILLIQSEQSMMLQNGSAVSQSAKILSQQVPQSGNALELAHQPSPQLKKLFVDSYLVRLYSQCCH
jgi:hypothetical protein